MIIGVLKESQEGKIVNATPTVKDLIKGGFEVHVQSNTGTPSFISDEDYQNSGAKIIQDAASILKGADAVIKVGSPSLDEIDQLKSNSIYISLIQTTIELDKVKRLSQKIFPFSMHLIPRTTLAQSMDALSSQANVAGYKAVLIGAMHLPVYMPLLMTVAGTIPPAKVLIIGAGVAGLQAMQQQKAWSSG